MIAIAGGVGVFLGKLLELSKYFAITNAKNTHDEIGSLRDEIKALRLDLDTWKEKYYSLLERVTVEQVVPKQKETKVSIENVVN